MQPNFRSPLLRFSENRRKRSRLQQLWSIISVIGLGHEIIKRLTKPPTTRQFRLRSGDQAAISLQKKQKNKS
jgi:hypothetical protein